MTRELSLIFISTACIIVGYRRRNMKKKICASRNNIIFCSNFIIEQNDDGFNKIVIHKTNKAQKKIEEKPQSVNVIRADQKIK